MKQEVEKTIRKIRKEKRERKKIETDRYLKLDR